MENSPADYWNVYTETLPREKIDYLMVKNFRRLAAFAKDHSPFYRKIYKHFDPQDIRRLADIRRLPLVEKEDLRAAQEDKAPFPFGELLCVDIQDVCTFRQTSGTTGKPVYVPESCESWQWRVEMWCHILWMAGFRETDRVFIPFGYNVYVAYWEAHFAAEKLGCMVVPGGALDTVGRVNKIMEVKATALLNTPTYGIHMAETAINMGLDPRQMGIRRMVCAGEPLPPATRAILEDMWQAEVYDHIGGTEPCAWGAMCKHRSGLHILEPYCLVEVLDMEHLQREVEPGELGIAVVTPLGRRSFPMLRFNTKDVVRQGTAGCTCGRTSKMIEGVVGRTDHLRKIRGVLFTPVSVEELLRGEFPEVGEFEILVEKKGVMDEISLKFEFKQESGDACRQDILQRLSDRLKIRTNLRFHLLPMHRGELPRYSLKACRFKDLRQ